MEVCAVHSSLLKWVLITELPNWYFSFPLYRTHDSIHLISHLLGQNPQGTDWIDCVRDYYFCTIPRNARHPRCDWFQRLWTRSGKHCSRIAGLNGVRRCWVSVCDFTKRCDGRGGNGAICRDWRIWCCDGRGCSFGLCRYCKREMLGSHRRSSNEGTERISERDSEVRRALAKISRLTFIDN